VLSLRACEKTEDGRCRKTDAKKKQREKREIGLGALSLSFFLPSESADIL